MFVAILAGGSGTRFWPASRKLRPKQLLALGKEAAGTMIEATAQRVRPLAEKLVVVTGRALADATKRALAKERVWKVMAEPLGKNTAPAVAWAAWEAAALSEETVVCVLPADAYIEDEGAFRAAIALAERAARAGAIVTLGVKPTRPETGYGYLEVGEASDVAGVSRVRAFVEKPDAERAAQYLEGGKHLWNAGIFVFRADVMKRAVREHMPELATAMDALEREGFADAALEREFAAIKSVSVDYGVMEKVARVDVVPVDCGWSDVGSWQAAWELAEKDASGNAVRAKNAVLVDAKGNFVSSDGEKVIALVGVSDLVVVETQDALLIVPRARAQEVKLVVDALAAKGANEQI